jgi:hypothetical protein
VEVVFKSIVDEDPFSAYGLSPLKLADRAVAEPFFKALKRPLSDYTFANTFIWADAINVHWAILRDCLCVFANGAGDLTVLMPPIGTGDVRAAAAEAVDICRAYNGRAGLPHATRLEYVDDNWLHRNPPPSDWRVVPMSGDYVYPTRRMIDLDGADLASTRQSRNRFARRYSARTERYDLARHLHLCVALLERWNEQVERLADQSGDTPGFKRQKEAIAVEAALRHHDALGLTGMVLFAGDELAGFTLGEPLGEDSFSVLIEKTDRRFVGAAQFIFSEFARQYWSHTAWCNAGDDWGIENLARVKQSYRPACRLGKFTLYPPVAPSLAAASARAPALLDKLMSPILELGLSPAKA